MKREISHFKTFKDAYKVFYHHLARFEAVRVGKKYQIRIINIFTGSLHKWITGNEVLEVDLKTFQKIKSEFEINVNTN